MKPRFQRDPESAAAPFFDTEKIRADFPLLHPAAGNRPLVYLDHAATSPRPACVIRAVREYYETCNATVHRSFYRRAEEATRKYEDSRCAAARLIGAPAPRSIIFTRGTTEGINLVAHAWGRKHLRPGDVILLTEMEHHSNLIPWQQAARATGARLRFVPVRDDGTLDGDAYHRWLRSEPVKMVAFTHQSNALGTINPAREMMAAARAAGARTLIDAAQSVAHCRIDVRALDCDFLAFSAHKMFGPMGVGVLFGRAELLEEMDPFLCGGEMADRVEPERSTWAELPRKFEAGTPPVADAIGLGAAIEYLGGLDRNAAEHHERAMTLRAVERLRGIPGLRIFGDAPARVGIVSFDVSGVHPHDLAQFLDGEGIAIRAGHLCCQPLMKRLGVAAVNRASLGFYTLPEEIDALAEAVEKARRYFSHGP